MVVTVPAGSARLVTGGGETHESAAYVIQRTGTAVLFLCQGETRPDDDWLSIAEALEPMPAEE